MYTPNLFNCILLIHFRFVLVRKPNHQLMIQQDTRIESIIHYASPKKKLEYSHIRDSLFQYWFINEGFLFIGIMLIFFSK